MGGCKNIVEEELRGICVTLDRGGEGRGRQESRMTARSQVCMNY